MERVELLFNHYKIHIELYKHYLELLIKFNLFYYAITGAILSFYFSNHTVTFIQYLLIFPFIMSFAFSIFFFYASEKAKNSRKEVVDIAILLELKTFPELNVLVILLKLFASLFMLTSFLLLTLIVFHNCIF
jgi:hypothetical protein